MNTNGTTTSGYILAFRYAQNKIQVNPIHFTITRPIALGVAMASWRIQTSKKFIFLLVRTLDAFPKA